MGGFERRGIRKRTDRVPEPVKLIFFPNCYLDLLIVSNVDLRCRKLPKGLKDYQAFNDLKQSLDEFTELVPLLEQMANKAMQRRHWDRISELVGRELDYESDQFSMKAILDCDLYKYREDIEVSLSKVSGQIRTGKLLFCKTASCQIYLRLMKTQTQTKFSF